MLQPADLDSALVLRHVSPAQDRAAPLLLHLCLRLPASATSVSLSAEYSKGFLNVFEIPPDPYRGFDVPAALLAFYPPADAIGGAGSGSEVASSAHAAVATWHELPVLLGGKVDGSSGDAAAAGGGLHRRAGVQVQDWLQTPLLADIAAPRAQQVYSDGLLVALAVPDVTMPYNVICLTSTVLAVYVGATLNSLLRRPSSEAAAAAAAAASPAARRKRVAKFVVVLVVFSGLGLYLDEALQEEAWKMLAGVGLVDPPATPGA